MRFSLLILILVTFSSCNRSSETPLPTVATVDLERYSGRWNQLARYENYTETGCVGVTAIYAPSGKDLTVTNNCYDGSGRLKDQIKGKLITVEGSHNSRFTTTFSWFQPQKYWIIMLADDYRYSVVGTPDREYLWILSRSTVLTSADRETILSTLTTLGFKPEKLYWTGFKAMCNVESKLK